MLPDSTMCFPRGSVSVEPRAPLWIGARGLFAALTCAARTRMRAVNGEMELGAAGRRWTTSTKVARRGAGPAQGSDSAWNLHRGRPRLGTSMGRHPGLKTPW